MSQYILGGLSVVSLEGSGLTLEQLLDSSLIQNAIKVGDNEVTSSDSNLDALNSSYTSISVVDEKLPFDEEDLFQCGRCKYEFSSLDSFLSHKSENCIRSKADKEDNSEASISHGRVATNDSVADLSHVSSSISTDGICDIGNPSEVSNDSESINEGPCSIPAGESPVVVSDGRFFNISLDGNQVFTLNENLDLGQEAERDAANNDVLTSSAITDIVTEIAASTGNSIDRPDISGCISGQPVYDPTSQEPHSENEKRTPKLKNMNHVFFHGKMAKPNLMIKENIKQPEHYCSYCNKGFGKNFDLQQHIRSHTGEKPYQCVVCGRAFAQRSNVKRHMETHKFWPKDSTPSVSNTVVKSKECSLEENMKKVSMYACPFCDFTHDSYLGLRGHMKQHNDRKIYRCFQKDCEENFGELGQFLDHVRLHEKDMEYKCHNCSKSFNSLQTLADHQFYHSIYPWPKKFGPSYFRCTKCMNKYASAEALDHHLKVSNHHFPCKECHKIFCSERKLKIHLALHGQAAVFTCSTCGKGFKQEHNLKLHQLIHTGEQPFECQICSMAFNRKDKLKRHLLVHQPKKFSCPFRETAGCKQEFRRKDKLNVHMQIHIRGPKRRGPKKRVKKGVTSNKVRKSKIGSPESALDEACKSTIASPESTQSDPDVGIDEKMDDVVSSTSRDNESINNVFDGKPSTFNNSFEVYLVTKPLKIDKIKSEFTKDIKANIKVKKHRLKVKQDGCNYIKGPGSGMVLDGLGSSTEMVLDDPGSAMVLDGPGSGMVLDDLGVDCSSSSSVILSVTNTRKTMANSQSSSVHSPPGKVESCEIGTSKIVQLQSHSIVVTRPISQKLVKYSTEERKFSDLEFADNELIKNIASQLPGVDNKISTNESVTLSSSNDRLLCKNKDKLSTDDRKENDDLVKMSPKYLQLQSDSNEGLSFGNHDSQDGDNVNLSNDNHLSTDDFVVTLSSIDQGDPSKAGLEELGVIYIPYELSQNAVLEDNIIPVETIGTKPLTVENTYLPVETMTTKPVESTYLTVETMGTKHVPDESTYLPVNQRLSTKLDRSDSLQLDTGISLENIIEITEDIDKGSGTVVEIPDNIELHDISGEGTFFYQWS